jgi:hypothetical protein
VPNFLAFREKILSKYLPCWDKKYLKSSRLIQRIYLALFRFFGESVFGAFFTLRENVFEKRAKTRVLVKIRIEAHMETKAEHFVPSLPKISTKTEVSVCPSLCYKNMVKKCPLSRRNQYGNLLYVRP